MKRIDDVDFLAFCGGQEQQYFCGLDCAETQIISRFEHGLTPFGDTMPWTKTHDNVRFRPTEVTLWSGINGHGKSLVLSHITAHLLHFSRLAIASMEMTVEATGYRLIRQMTANPQPSNGVIKECIAWCCDNRLWLYDQTDSVAPERILGMCIYAMSELKCDHVIIDSLMKCGISPENYEAQSKFVDRLCWAAKTYGGHIHLVSHIRKGQSEDDVPDKFDVKGSSAITDMVDNVILVHRNKKKERAVAAGKEVNELEPDTTLIVAKQRHWDWEGGVALYWHPASHQYLSGPKRRPTWYGAAQERMAGKARGHR